MKTKAFGMALVLSLLCGAGIWADGAGGTFLGYTFGNDEIPGTITIPSSGQELLYFGGYGYGVGRWGSISGGFGLAVLDRGNGGYAGGVGGFVTGIRFLRVPHVALVSWTGLGGLSAGGRGWFVGFEEVDLEVGLPIVPWFMPTAYVGYQVTGNLIPGLPFRDSFTYNAVAGIRVLWGNFR